MALATGATIFLLVLRSGAIPPFKTRPVPGGSAIAAEGEGPAQPQIGRLSIAVLPFANLAADPGQEYFADGITQYITDDLSRISGSLVISRASTLNLGGSDADVRMVGRDLRVGYVLKGSVGRRDDQYEVTVRLFDAGTGEKVWSERYLSSRARVLAIQSEITGQIARRLQLELIEVENRRLERKPPETLDSLDLALRGFSVFNRGNTKTNMTEARGLFERALALDPDNAEALIGLAHVYQRFASQAGWTQDTGQAFRVGLAAAEKAVALTPANAYAHFVHGILLSGLGRVVEADQALERAIGANFNFAPAYAFRGYNKVFLGRAGETLSSVRDALTLSPRDPNLGIWCFFAGAAQLLLGNEADAVDWLNRALAASPNYPAALIWLAAAQALLGDLEQAKAAAEALRQQRPGPVVTNFRRQWLERSENPIYRQQIERVLRGLTAAGLSAV